MQEEIIKNKKTARSLFYRNPDEKHVFFYLALKKVDNVVLVNHFFCLSIPKRDLNAKETPPNIEVCPESLRFMLEYWYIERGLLDQVKKTRFSSGFL